MDIERGKALEYAKKNNQLFLEDMKGQVAATIDALIHFFFNLAEQNDR